MKREEKFILEEEKVNERKTMGNNTKLCKS